jgi:hypothetical protein
MNEPLPSAAVPDPVSPVARHYASVRKGTSSLLTAQDVESLIEPFARSANARLEPASLVYQHDARGVIYSVGAPASHSLTYRLKFNGIALGELSLTRDKLFTGEEIQWLESQIFCLVSALHSALSSSDQKMAGHPSTHTSVV